MSESWPMDLEYQHTFYVILHGIRDMTSAVCSMMVGTSSTQRTETYTIFEKILSVGHHPIIANVVQKSTHLNTSASWAFFSR